VRVLYFTRDYTPHDHRFLTSLAESGQEVFFLRLEHSGRQLEDRTLPPEIRQVPWQGGQGSFRWRDLPGLLISLKRLLREIQPDVLHAGPIQTVAFLAALTGFRPLVTMSWGSDLLKDAERSTAYRWITRYTLSNSTVLVGDCQAVREKAASFGFPIARTFIFPWGIALERFSPVNRVAAPVLSKVAGAEDRVDCTTGGETASSFPERTEALRCRLGWQDKFVVLSLRSWEPVYGVDIMLRGFARAAAEVAARGSDDMRLLLLGGGSLARMVHQVIQEHGLQDQIYLGGQVNQANLPDIYRAADLYLSASHSDGSSVSLMEALGSGLPVVITDIPSNREWVADGAQGWLFPDGDEQAVARYILRAYQYAKEQPERLEEMRRAARLRAEQRADWKKNFEVLLTAYQAAVEQIGAHPARRKPGK
jgi:L-malate glycosyltransferase